MDPVGGGVASLTSVLASNGSDSRTTAPPSSSFVGFTKSSVRQGSLPWRAHWYVDPALRWTRWSCPCGRPTWRQRHRREWCTRSWPPLDILCRSCGTVCRRRCAGPRQWRRPPLGMHQVGTASRVPSTQRNCAVVRRISPEPASGAGSVPPPLLPNVFVGSWRITVTRSSVFRNAVASSVVPCAGFCSTYSVVPGGLHGFPSLSPLPPRFPNNRHH